MLGQSAVPKILFVMHGNVCPIGRNRRRGKGPRGSSPCHGAPHVPWARQKYAKGVRRSCAHVARVERDGNCYRRGAGVGRFDDVMGARARRKASLSLGRFSS
jgi:hypothetical protein